MANGKVIFLSHAWADHKIVQPFKDAFFGAANSLLKSEYEFFYTSDPQDPSIKAGEVIWDTIEKRLLRCEHFVAFCSPSYFKSQTCQNELGAIKALCAKAKMLKEPLPQITPIKLDDFSPKFYNQIINQGVVNIEWFKKDSVIAVVKTMESALTLTPVDTDPRYSDIATKAAEARDEIARSKDHRIVSLWEKHLADPTYPNSPVTFFIELCQYPDIAVDLSEKGAELLVWALNGSPLLATRAYDDPSSYLMDHDRRFAGLKVSRKYRRVVFTDWNEAKAYLDCNPAYHKNATGRTLTLDQLNNRREAFVKSVEVGAGAQLRFTTRPRANQAVAQEHANSLGADYWDFGYVKTTLAADDEFLFVSGFDSVSFVPDGQPLHTKAMRHLSLYSKPHDDRYAVFSYPAYAPLYGPLRGLFDVVDSLTNPSSETPRKFVDKDHIGELEETS